MAKFSLKPRMRQLAMGTCVLALLACNEGEDTNIGPRTLGSDTALPPMRTFVSTSASPVYRANADLVGDFLDLNFRIETGRRLTHLSKFPGPVTVRVMGDIPSTLPTDLARLIRRFRNEAKIDISLTNSADANITIIMLTRSQLRREVPGAACFVVPNVTSLEDFREKRRNHQISWVGISHRDKAAIMLPSDAAPQEIRDCLHEELAQALGPLNDLYRLPNSVFNDDNFHSVLTSFDMMMLRALYHPSLSAGMDRASVARQLPSIFRDLNPGGENRARTPTVETPVAWTQAMHQALANATIQVKRQQAARRAIQLRPGIGPDVRNGFAHYALGRLSMQSDPAEAYNHLRQADAIFAGRPDMAIHRAKVAVQLASFALRDGDGAAVLQAVDPHISAASSHENAAVLASLLMFRAEGLDLVGRSSEAQSVRLDALGWARYGYGGQSAVFRRLKEIQDLNPAN